MQDPKIISAACRRTDSPSIWRLVWRASKLYAVLYRHQNGLEKFFQNCYNIYVRLRARLSTRKFTLDSVNDLT